MIAKTPNIRGFVAKTHLSRFTHFFRQQMSPFLFVYFRGGGVAERGQWHRCFTSGLPLHQHIFCVFSAHGCPLLCFKVKNKFHSEGNDDGDEYDSGASVAFGINTASLEAAWLMHCPATYNNFSCCNIQRSNVLSGVRQGWQSQKIGNLYKNRLLNAKF